MSCPLKLAAAEGFDLRSEVQAHPARPHCGLGERAGAYAFLDRLVADAPLAGDVGGGQQASGLVDGAERGADFGGVSHARRIHEWVV